MTNKKSFRFFVLTTAFLVGASSRAMVNPEVLAAQKPLKEKIAAFDTKISDATTSAEMEKAASEKTLYCQGEFSKRAKAMEKKLKDKKSELSFLNQWVSQVTAANKTQMDLIKALTTEGGTADVVGVQISQARMECRALEDLLALEAK